MLKKSRFLLIAALIAGLIPVLIHNVYALPDADLASGLTIQTGIKNDIPFKRVTRFDNYDIGTSGVIVFNNYGSTTAEAGVVDVAGWSKRNIVIEITNMQDAGTTSLHYYASIGTTTMSVPVMTINYSGTQTDSIPLSEDAEYYKFGISRTGDFGAKVTVKELYTK